jgi:hypothetical protein
MSGNFFTTLAAAHDIGEAVIFSDGEPIEDLTYFERLLWRFSKRLLNPGSFGTDGNAAKIGIGCPLNSHKGSPRDDSLCAGLYILGISL